MAADENDKQKGEQADSTTLGQRLRVAREADGRSVDEVSHDLHLDREVVLALESDDFESLGAPVFAKGYLRSYCRLLGLPETEIADVFLVAEPEPEEFRTLSTHRELKSGANLVNFMLWVALGLIALVGAAYLLMGDDPEAQDGIDKGEFVAPEVIQPAVIEPTSAESASELQEEVVEVAPEPEPEPEPVPEPEVVEPVTVKLTLNFLEECWVEVSDSRKRLIYGLEKSGKSLSVEGVPPFKFFLGNVKAVEVLANDQVYDVPGRRSGNKTARFVIEADDLPGAFE